MGRVEQEVRRETGTGTDLWRIVIAPTVWAVHFVACYAWVAMHCEKAGRDAALDPARTGVFVLTGVALVLIALNTHRLWRRWARSLTDDDLDFEHNTAEERHRFLGHTALMLSVLSAAAVVYVAIPAVLVETCR